MDVTKKIKMKPIALSAAVLLALAGCSIQPEKLTQAEITEIIHHDKALLYKDQEPIRAELSLSDVMARALIYNLEHRTQRMAEAVAMGQFELAKYEMLPTLTGAAGVSSRNKTDASTSLSIDSGTVSDEPTTSQENTNRTADLGLSWNILDFGVSYYQAKQEADRYLISDESRKKVLLSLLHQAQTVYWQAVTAQELQGPVERALDKAVQALTNIEKGIDEGAYLNLIQPLKLKRQLLEAVTELETLKESLIQSRVALASLINVPLNEFPQLKAPASLALPNIEASVEEMELIALQNSTNLAEQIYSTRIERLETRKALLRLLPGLEFNYSVNFDSNKYLVNNNWTEAGIQVSWNLLRLASASQTLETAEIREKLAEQKRLAVSMAVITQLNLSLQKYKSAQRNLLQAEKIKEIDQQILAYSANSTAVNNTSIIENISTELGALQTRQKYFGALVSAQEAYSSVWVALGLSPVPTSYQGQDVELLSQEIEANLVNWGHGYLALPTLQLKSDNQVNSKEAL